MNEWLALIRAVTLDAAIVGSPAVYPSAEAAELAVVTLSNRKIMTADASGAIRASMPLDLNPTTAAITAGGRIFAADVAGSIYCFQPDGKRLWKHERTGKAADFKVLIPAADSVFLSDSRGHLFAIGFDGKPRLELTATTYRVSAPALGDVNGDGVLDIVFGTEDQEILAVDARGRLLWSRKLRGRFGRALPVLHGSEVFVATPFVGPSPGVYVLDARTGAAKWQARSVLQSYHSTVITDVNGDGAPQLFYGDKNTRLFCYGLDGSKRWDVQLEGRGIFFAPAVAKGVIYQGARNGPLNVVGADGRILQSVAVPGGSNSAPVLVRWKGEDGWTLLQADGANAVRMFRTRAEPLPAGPARSLRGLGAGSMVRVTIENAKVRPSDPEPPTRAFAGQRIWRIANPWAQGTARSEPGPVRVRMLGNEYESAAIAIENLEDRAVDLRIEATGPVKIHEVPLVLPDRTEAPSEDVLPLLGEAGLVRLGAKETRKIWLTVHSRGLKPGGHRFLLRVGDLLSLRAPVEVPLEIAVSKVQLPDKRVYQHVNWLTIPGDPVQRQAVIEDAVEHGTNVLVASPSAHADVIRQLKGRVTFLIPGGIADDAALAKVTSDLRALGLDYADYALYLQDEPGLMGKDADFDKYVAMVRRVKQADPRVRIYANPAGGARSAILGPLDGLVDIWCPDLHLFRDEPLQLGALFRRAPHFWHFEAPADQRNLDPLGYYRMKPWVAFQLGMTGGGYWVYSSGTSFWFHDPARNTEYGTVYMTPRGPVTTKRWEAFRDGAEDFDLLWMARQVPTLRTLTDEAVAFVTRDQDQASDIARQLRTFAPDYFQWMEYRRRIIEALEKAL